MSNPAGVGLSCCNFEERGQGCRQYLLLAPLILALPALASSQVTISVDAAKPAGASPSSWAYFGYDEPNNTYTTNGKKLLGELAASSAVPIHVRTHFLLTNGSQIGGLKWGWTNAYSEDANGKPTYNWEISDRILGTFVAAGIIPVVEIGFMPKALSTHPEPYEPNWQPGKTKSEDYYIGWTYPPKDYANWGELIFAWVKHCVEKYGKETVAKWDWEVWNEPDIAYWHGTPEEYDTLYDRTVSAVRRALPGAHVGGPASTGPGDPKAASFLRQFLEHCAAKNIPLDFVSFHAKGRPKLEGGHVRMGMASELNDATSGFAILASFPQFKNLPVILSEADPEGCAACSARVYPQNAYRNGPLYASYEAAAYKGLMEIATRQGVHLQGVLTWAFEFEGQPYFEGFRDLASNGVDKPVLNFFRMAGLLQGDQVAVESSGSVTTENILRSGVTDTSDVDALATLSAHRLNIMVWNYRDDDIAGEPADVHLNLHGLPERVLVQQYRIDGDHSNAYSAWRQMGSPKAPSPAQYTQLEAAGQLQELDSPHWIQVSSGIDFQLPLQGISLFQFSW